MSKIVSLIAAMMVAAITATGASAAHDPRVPALQRQVAALSQLVTQHAQIINRNADFETCHFVSLLDIDIDFTNVFAAMFGQPPYSGTVPNDNGACSRVGLPPPSPMRSLASSGYNPSASFDAQIARLAKP